jgi:transcription antitermination factor NusG
MLDIAVGHAPPCLAPDARGPPFPLAPCDSHIQIPEITIKAARGGFRANALGGLRSPPGGRPRKPMPSAPDPDVFRWYVVRAKHGRTDAADEEIREAGFDVVTAKKCLPRTRARRSSSGSLIRAQEERFVPLFVRYVIVALNLTDPSWHVIRDMESVERIISGNHHTNNGVGIPIAVPDQAITDLRKILSPAGIWFPLGYRAPVDDDDPIGAGSGVRILDGPLADIAAVCDQSDGKRIEMLMGWFNRDNVKTTMAQSSVERTTRIESD